MAAMASAPVTARVGWKLFPSRTGRMPAGDRPRRRGVPEVPRSNIGEHLPRPLPGGVRIPRRNQV